MEKKKNNTSVSSTSYTYKTQDLNLRVIDNLCKLNTCLTLI